MTAAGWAALAAELDRLAAPIELWWRDDDAVAATPALDRLLALTQRYGAPLVIAAVPEHVEDSLARRLERAPDSVRVAPHGFRHDNHAPAGEKKAEFRAHRPLAARIDEAGRGLERVRGRFGARSVPMFVPPWNRIADDMAPRLAELGYRALSTNGPRRARYAAPGVAQINTHLDPIDWRGSRSAVDEDALLLRLTTLLCARREQRADPAEPIGLLTHHLAHDEAIWTLVERVVSRLTETGAARWVDVAQLPQIKAAMDP